MSLDRIYKIPIADLPADLPVQTVFVATDATNNAYLVGDGGFTDWDLLLTAGIVGSWDSSTGLQEGESYDTNEPPNVIGTPTHPVTADYASWVRPLGNDAGRATGLLDSMRWAGHIEQKFLETDNRYTSADSPFTLEIIREDHGSTALPWDTNTVYALGDYATSGGMWRSLQDANQGNTPFGGSAFWEFINQSGPWGWSVVMLSADPLRDITARAVGIYTDPECTIFEYTTGAFVQDGSHGNNYYTVCPPGNRLPAPDQVNFALLLGAAQEGFFNLPENSGTTEALFWASDQ